MFVYILKSGSFPDKIYVGLTEDVERRLKEHNSGKSPYTRKYKPGKIEASIWFSNVQKAAEFEKYLKTGSGNAFRIRHFQ
jgi:predicted GIY-YIG superfamily endonuclease